MTNAAAIGYMILAMKNLGYSEDEIKKVEGSMRSEMDFTTETKAEKVYNEF
ncbi:hypothetical protein [Shewanella chilikensis]|uniref:hypothetical protein n=1 Tax=Shewanella chilikensis TaxID=558541 RepID=UPI00300549AF